MNNTKIPLTFPVFYFGLIAGRTMYTQVDAVNIIFNNSPINECVHNSISGPTVSNIIHGRRAIGKNYFSQIQNLSSEELQERLQKLNLQNATHTISAFHEFLTDHISLDASDLYELNQIFLNVNSLRKPYAYIARILLETMKYSTHAIPLPPETAHSLKSLGVQRDADLFSEQRWQPTESSSEISINANVAEVPVSAVSSIVETMVPQLVSTTLSTLFVHGELELREFESMKSAHFGELITKLLDSGKMTYYEYYKCHNFLEIAKKADLELKKKPQREPEAEQIDFDWFLRFFDAAGNIRNEDMQSLWSKVLAGEIQHPGKFSLRTLETLRNMTVKEALVFKRVSSLILSETDGTKFVFCDAETCDSELNERYGIFTPDILLLEECGILNSLQIDNHVVFYDDDASGFMNENNLVLLFRPKRDDLDFFRYKSYPITQTASQLLPIVQDEAEDSYLLELGNLLRTEHSEDVIVTAHTVLGISGDELNIDLDHDLLSEEIIS